MNKDNYTKEEVKMLIKAFHLDALEGVYSKDDLNFCNSWISSNLDKVERPDSPVFGLRQEVIYDVGDKEVVFEITEVNHKKSSYKLRSKDLIKPISLQVDWSEIDNL